MDENQIKRIPPHNDDAEKSVIGAMIIDQEARVYASEHLLKEDFFNIQLGILFEAITELNNEKKNVDSITLIEKLKVKQAPPEICESAYISELVYAVPTSASIKQYCTIVHEKAVVRNLIKASEKLSARGYDGSEPVDGLLESAEEEIFRITRGRGSDDLVPISQVVMNTLDNIQSASKAGGSVTGIPTGFTDLDWKTAGMQPSDLILIAARPSMGKTAFVLNIAEYAAVKKDYHVVIFSLEMGKEQLVNRLISMNSRVNSNTLRTGNLSDGDWDRVVESAGYIGRSNLMIDDTPGISIMDLSSKCRKIQMEHGLDMIIIDYLQLMTSSGGRKHNSRQEEISDISRSLKALARDLHVPVIALSQLSRAVEQRPDHKPMLSDLRESGAIEQDADVVMFLYRDDYYNKDSERKGITDVIIAKQRNGGIGEIELVWLADYTKFGNKERRQE